MACLVIRGHYLEHNVTVYLSRNLLCFTETSSNEKCDQRDKDHASKTHRGQSGYHSDSSCGNYDRRWKARRERQENWRREEKGNWQSRRKNKVIYSDDYKSVDEIKTLKFIKLDYPLLLLPFINKLSYLIGKRIQVSIDDINAECNLNTCVLADHKIKSSIIKKANTVIISILENEDNFSSKSWNELYEMSTETFVEETEQSKQTGAGAGLQDND